MKKIIITTSTFAEFDSAPMTELKNNGYEPVLNPFKRTLTGDEFIALSKDAIGVIAGTETISAETLVEASTLKVISRCGVGMENVDLTAAAKLGIKVCNTPLGPTKAVAELVMGLCFNLSRKISQSDRHIRQGIWKKQMGSLVSGKTMGLIGFGNIGRAVAELASLLGMKILFYDPQCKRDVGGFQSVNIEQIYQDSDFISLHVSLNEQTKKMIGLKEIGQMKSSAFLINASRGGVVDEESLLQAIGKNMIAGAALDVFEKEPYEGPFLHLDNVILTPHIGSYAKESRIQMELDAAQNLINSLKEIDK